MTILVGDTLYFDANDGSSGYELWAHDTSNSSTWRVADIHSGTGSSDPGYYMAILVGDTLYFSANDGSSGYELWAHDTSNSSTWRVADIYSGTSSSNPGYHMAILVGDTLYFSANDGSSGTELWAHDTSNASTWRWLYQAGLAAVPRNYMTILVGDTLYFSAYDGSSGQNCGLMIPQTPQLGGGYIHRGRGGSTPDNTWRYSSVIRSTSVRMMAAAENCGLMIPQTPQLGGWLISTAGLAAVTLDNTWRYLVGDTLYFDANDGSSGVELWAHDTSNASTWRVADIYSGSSFANSNPGQHMSILVGDTLYFDAGDASSGYELWALQPSEITSLSSGSGSGGSGSGGMTNLTNATSCVASPSLPNGLNIDSSTCTISGTPSVHDKQCNLHGHSQHQQYNIPDDRMALHLTVRNHHLNGGRCASQSW